MELSKLESTSIYIIREAYHAFRAPCLLWSAGKDSTVLLWLCRKAFFGHVPFPLLHIDTTYKIPEMIAYRDRLAREFNLDLRYAVNESALASGQTFPQGTADRASCCKALKTQALSSALAGDALSGTGKRYRFSVEEGRYVPDESHTGFDGVLVGLRADEEGSRSKERYFSPRSTSNQWDISVQPPEFWNQFNTDFPPGTHVRVHPLLDWTEVDIWRYIAQERIATVSLYYDQGDGTRYRSIGCGPCTERISSTARTPREIVEELESGNLSRIAERAGRAQDVEAGGTLEFLRREGYM